MDNPPITVLNLSGGGTKIINMADNDMKKAGNTVAAVGVGLLAVSAIAAAPLLAVWGGWALLNGGIVSAASKKKD